MMALVPVTLVFPLERPVFLKEEGAKLYSTFPYWLSHNIIELPLLVIFPLITCLIIYWLAGLSNTAVQFFTFYLISFLISFNGASVGLILGSVIQDAKSVSAVTPVVLIPLVIFAGFIKNRSNYPVWLGWI